MAYYCLQDSMQLSSSSSQFPRCATSILQLCNRCNHLQHIHLYFTLLCDNQINLHANISTNETNPQEISTQDELIRCMYGI